MGKEKESEQPICFVIMPIADVETYDSGHFGRVYEYIIKPACMAAGFKPVRADEVQATNYIVVDILRKIIDAEMVICDLSSRNPNVLYELGIRQAFNLPVTLIRDSRTPRIFDIQGLRDIEYEEGLRIDKINIAVEILANTLKNNSQLNEGEVNSIIQLLGIKPASAPTVEVSKDTSLLLEAISSIGERLSRLERDANQSPLERSLGKPGRGVPQSSIEAAFFNGAGEWITEGTRVRHLDGDEGKVIDINNGLVRIGFDDGAIVSMTISSAARDLELLNS
jgi:hypothetical protein